MLQSPGRPPMTGVRSKRETRRWTPSPKRLSSIATPSWALGSRADGFEQTRQERDRQALRAGEHHALALQPTLRSRQLLSEKLVLRNKRRARTELPHHQPHERASRQSIKRRGPLSRIGA